MLNFSKFDPTRYDHTRCLSTSIADIEFIRNVDDAFKEIKDHLTKEEKLLFSIFKNSKKQHNHIHKVFLEKHCGKRLSSSAITKRKKRILSVLYVVGKLLRFKRSHNIDYRLKRILTRKQYTMLMLYERRKTYKEITDKLDLQPRSKSLQYLFYTALYKIDNSGEPDLLEYKRLLRDVLRYSRKYPKFKH